MKKVIISALLLLLPGNTFAAIAFDSFIATNNGGSGPDLTYTLTTLSNADVFICVGVFAPVGDDITGVTVAGAPASRLQYTSSGLVGHWMYEATAVSSGVNTIVISSNQAVESIYSTAMSYTGADTTAASTNSVVNSGSGGSITNPITVSDSNSWVIGCANTDNAPATGVSWTHDRGAAGITGSDSNGTRPAGADSMDWSTMSGNWASSAAELLVASAGPTPPATTTPATAYNPSKQEDLFMFGVITFLLSLIALRTLFFSI